MAHITIHIEGTVEDFCAAIKPRLQELEVDGRPFVVANFTVGEDRIEIFGPTDVSTADVAQALV